MPFLREYLFKIRHRWAVLCDERQDSLIFFAFLQEGKFPVLKFQVMSESVAVIRLSGYPRSIRCAQKCKILVLNSFSEEVVRLSLSASPLMKPLFFTTKGWQLHWMKSWI